MRDGMRRRPGNAPAFTAADEREVRPAVAICARSGADANAAAVAAVHCDPVERRVWIERATGEADGGANSIVFSSKFDAVFLPERSVQPVYDACVRPQVAYALSAGKRGAATVLLFGNADGAAAIALEAVVLPRLIFSSPSFASRVLCNDG